MNPDTLPTAVIVEPLRLFITRVFTGRVVVLVVLVVDVLVEVGVAARKGPQREARVLGGESEAARSEHDAQRVPGGGAHHHGRWSDLWISGQCQLEESEAAANDDEQ